MNAITNRYGIHYFSSFFHSSLADQLRDPKLTVVVIQSMAIGIVIPPHLASQFGFLRACESWPAGDDDATPKAEPVTTTNPPPARHAKFVIIDTSWDTRSWNMQMLMHAHTWLLEISHKTRRELEYMNAPLPWIDLHFLDSLCFDYKPDDDDNTDGFMATLSAAAAAATTMTTTTTTAALPPPPPLPPPPLPPPPPALQHHIPADIYDY